MAAKARPQKGLLPFSSTFRIARSLAEMPPSPMRPTKAFGSSEHLVVEAPPAAVAQLLGGAGAALRAHIRGWYAILFYSRWRETVSGEVGRSVHRAVGLSAGQAPVGRSDGRSDGRSSVGRCVG